MTVSLLVRTFFIRLLIYLVFKSYLKNFKDRFESISDLNCIDLLSYVVKFLLLWISYLSYYKLIEKKHILRQMVQNLLNRKSTHLRMLELH